MWISTGFYVGATIVHVLHSRHWSRHSSTWSSTSLLCGWHAFLLFLKLHVIACIDDIMCWIAKIVWSWIQLNWHSYGVLRLFDFITLTTVFSISMTETLCLLHLYGTSAPSLKPRWAWQLTSINWLARAFTRCIECMQYGRRNQLRRQFSSSTAL